MHHLLDVSALFVVLCSIFAVGILILPFFIEFYLTSFLLIGKGCSILNKQHESLFQHWVSYRCFHFFLHSSLLTSPSFIRIQFKTLKLVCVISSFYNVFVQFSSHSQFLNYSAEEYPCCIFSGAYNIKLVNSFILVWHSDYELSSKTQKPFFILKESSKCHNINYRAKNHVVMFCFGLQSFARFINTNASYFNTHRLESEGNFPETFISQ